MKIYLAKMISFIFNFRIAGADILLIVEFRYRSDSLLIKVLLDII